MKRLFLMLLGAMTLCPMQAQIVEQGEPALVYYTPKNTVAIELSYSVESFEPGMFAQYAESMIGATNAVTERKEVYTLKRAQIGTKTEADYTRPHKIVPEAGVPMLLNINAKGLLIGYNIDNTPKKDDRLYDHKDKKNSSKTTKSEVAPLPEEVLTASSPLAQAHAVAKQIFHIRETRSYLLNGEVEHAPADGKSMELVLEELDKQEKALTELFIGKTTKAAKHKVVYIDPDKEEKILFFSEENGFTDAENIDADTIKITLKADKQVFAAPVVEKKKKNVPAVTQLVYNLPGHCAVSVLYKGQPLARRTLDIAQFGIDVPVSKELFVGGLPKIVFCEKTGAIVSISK